MTTFVLAALLIWPFVAKPTPQPTITVDVGPIATPALDERREFCRSLFLATSGTCLGRPEELGGCAQFKGEFCPKEKE